MKRKSLIIALTLSLLLAFTACSDDKDNKTNTSSSNASSTAQETNSEALEEVKVNALITEIDNDDKTLGKIGENPITLSGDSAKSDSSNVKIDGTKITITKSGTYTLSGKLADGQIIINSTDKGIVRLVLNGAKITCKNTSPIYVEQAKKVVVTLAENTENIISDTKDYEFTSSDTDEPNATFFSKDDLTFNGSGKLTVSANYNNGITSKDKLIIVSGEFDITSVDDAIMGKDYAVIAGGNFNIKSTGDGIKSTNDTDTSLGYIKIAGGEINIEAEKDAIQAQTNLYILDGTLNLKSGGGAENGTSLHGGQMGMGGDFNTQSNSSEQTESTKGLKADGTIAISGGTITLNTCDDSIHSAGIVTIDGGKIEITAGDDAIHSDSNIIINDGEINITSCYEGIEAINITINGGTIDLIASDDGFNVNCQSNDFGGPNKNTDTTKTSDGTLTIAGGKITVNADGDGLDSNGSIKMTGGYVLVYGPENDGNGTLDYDLSFELDGGTFIAIGSSGMAQTPSNDSDQAYITVGQTFTSGQKIVLKDEDGDDIVSFEVLKQCSLLEISDSKIENDKEYTLYCDGEEIGTATVSNNVGTMGNAVSGGVGGGMGPGGMGGMMRR